LTRDILTIEGRFDWERYDSGTFQRLDVLTMGRFDCKADEQWPRSTRSSSMAARPNNII